MAARKQGRRAANQAATTNGSSTLSQEALMQQQVLRHYAKTVYFNDLWRSFLTNLAGLVLLMGTLTLQRMYHSASGLGFTAGFELLSIVIATTTVFFVKRWSMVLLAFKAAFAFSLLQSVWFGHSYYRRKTLQDPEIGDLAPDQFAFGAIYFVVCWVADRYMMRSQDLAKKTADEIQEVLRKAQ